MSDTTTIGAAPYTMYNGVAAKDIEPDSTTLLVICPELMPETAYGTLDAGITTSQHKLKTRDGKPINAQTVTSNHLVATWEGKSNQRYPPLIKKGEPVEIYKAGNQDKFLWRATGRGRDFRSLDRLVTEVSASDPSKPPREKDDTNTYTSYMDPVNKKVGFKTSKDNGEVSAIAFDADLAKGTATLSDDDGNFIMLDTGKVSGAPFLHMALNTGITIKLQDKDLLIKVPGKMLVSSGDRMIFDSPITIFNLEKKGSFIVNAASVAFNAAGDIIHAAGGVLGLNGAAAKVKGMLVAATMRVGDISRGPLGPEYTGPTISQPLESPVRDGNNTPDTAMSPTLFLYK